MGNENLIPEWDITGCLPIAIERIAFSPYQMTSIEFVQHFNKTKERAKLLKDWLKYRHEIASNIYYGFEWVNGSFVENVEKTRKSPPNDIDVVDFVIFKKELSPQEYKTIKRRYHVDAFLVSLLSQEKLAEMTNEKLFAWYDTNIKRIAQWNLEWGHTHDGNSKGFIKINFNQDDDEHALKLLEEYE